MIETERLLLRPWRDGDREPFAAMGRDPDVMACFPSLLTREQSDGLVDRVIATIDRDGFGFWAVEVKGGASFAGFCGISRVPFEAPFTPAVETGWRFARAHWGHGYATEAARAALAYGFGTLGLAEIVAFLLPANARSAAVCERLGMRRDPAGDFDHPRFTEDQRSVAGFPQRRHILYRIGR
ncbi:MAG: GNAT family N-acetyltransferase [Acidobacteriota bacterium]